MNEPRTIGGPCSVPCSWPGWEALAKTTLLTHEEDSVNCPMSSNYSVKLRPKIPSPDRPLCLRAESFQFINFTAICFKTVKCNLIKLLEIVPTSLERGKLWFLFHGLVLNSDELILRKWKNCLGQNLGKKRRSK